MKFGRIIGTVVATVKDASFTGKKLLVIQPVNAEGKPIDSPLVGMDAVGAGAGELVMYVGGKEASFPFLPEEVPVDAGIIAIIDSIDKVRRPGPEAGKPARSAEPTTVDTARAAAPLESMRLPSADGGGDGARPARAATRRREVAATAPRKRRSKG